MMEGGDITRRMLASKGGLCYFFSPVLLSYLFTVFSSLTVNDSFVWHKC
jgi:hypothetical protein